ncbi:MAG: hypothetical protein NXI20_15135 [bacterium]|nr:hypothetical protein [bacterium]
MKRKRLFFQLLQNLFNNQQKEVLVPVKYNPAKGNQYIQEDH